LSQAQLPLPRDSDDPHIARDIGLRAFSVRAFQKNREIQELIVATEEMIVATKAMIAEADHLLANGIWVTI
jgi:hypothetical protein